jgi:hypothetical protein
LRFGAFSAAGKHAIMRARQNNRETTHATVVGAQEYPAPIRVGGLQPPRLDIYLAHFQPDPALPRREPMKRID